MKERRQTYRPFGNFLRQIRHWLGVSLGCPSHGFSAAENIRHPTVAGLKKNTGFHKLFSVTRLIVNIAVLSFNVELFQVVLQGRWLQVDLLNNGKFTPSLEIRMIRNLSISLRFLSLFKKNRRRGKNPSPLKMKKTYRLGNSVNVHLMHREFYFYGLFPFQLNIFPLSFVYGKILEIFHTLFKFCLSSFWRRANDVTYH